MIGNPRDPRRNAEGYADPTAYRAIYYNADEQMARAFLNQYYILTKKIEILTKDIADIDEEISGITINLDGMPHGTDISDKTGNLAIKLADYHMERIKLRSRAWEKRKQITDTIEQLDNVNLVQILKLRYVHHITWEKIAVEIDKSWTQTHRLHHMALQELAKILKK